METLSSDTEREGVRNPAASAEGAGGRPIGERALKTLNPQDFPPYMVPKLLETSAAVSAAALVASRELGAEERRRGPIVGNRRRA
jgi:hypothetical protein